MASLRSAAAKDSSERDTNTAIAAQAPPNTYANVLAQYQAHQAELAKSGGGLMGAGLDLGGAYLGKATLGIDRSKPKLHQVGQMLSNMIPFNQERKMIANHLRTARFVKNGLTKIANNPRGGMADMLHDGADLYLKDKPALRNGLHVGAAMMDNRGLSGTASVKDSAVHYLGSGIAESAARTSQDPETQDLIRRAVHPATTPEERQGAIGKLAIKQADMPDEARHYLNSAVDTSSEIQSIGRTMKGLQPGERPAALAAIAHLKATQPPEQNSKDLSERLGYITGKNPQLMPRSDEDVMLKHSFNVGKEQTLSPDAPTHSIANEVSRRMLADPHLSSDARAKLQTLKNHGTMNNESLMSGIMDNEREGAHAKSAQSAMRMMSMGSQAMNTAQAGEGHFKTYRDMMASEDPHAYAQEAAKNVMHEATATAKDQIASHLSANPDADMDSMHGALSTLTKVHSDPSGALRDTLTQHGVPEPVVRGAQAVSQGKMPKGDDVHKIIDSVAPNSSLTPHLHAAADSLLQGKPNSAAKVVAHAAASQLPEPARTVAQTGLALHDAFKSTTPEAGMSEISSGFQNKRPPISLPSFDSASMQLHQAAASSSAITNARSAAAQSAPTSNTSTTTPNSVAAAQDSTTTIPPVTTATTGAEEESSSSVPSQPHPEGGGEEE